MVLEIVDTVYLVAYLRRSDPLHSEALSLINSLGTGKRVSQAALLELDLLMKSRGFSAVERMKTWVLLGKVIPAEAVEPLLPQDFAASSLLINRYSLDYFDALIAAQCILRRARPVTTDSAILSAVKSTDPRDVEEELRKLL